VVLKNTGIGCLRKNPKETTDALVKFLSIFPLNLRLRGRANW